MPTIFSHGAIGFTAGKALSGDLANRHFITACIILAALPDVDGLFFNVIPHEHVLGHRGLTHSLLFAAVAGLATALIFTRAGWNEKRSFASLAALFAFVTASHGFFDAMTSGGSGVAFFAPFNNSRHFFPFRPIPVSPMSVAGLMTARGMRVLQAELGFFWTFAAAAAVWNRRSKWRMVVAALLLCTGAAAWIAVAIR